MRNTFINTIIDLTKDRDDVLVLSGDAGLGVFDSFQQGRSERFLNMGVAEQNMAGFAAGLTMAGFKVCMYNITPFVLYRCYEQIRNDICYQRLGVIMVGIGSGVTYAPAGMTHYSVEDIGIARTLPNLQVLSPIDPIEARAVAKYALDVDSPVYVRLAKRGEPNIHRDEQVDVTSPHVVEEGEGIAIVFHGSIGVEVLRARARLAEEGVFPRLISLPMVQPVPFDRLGEMLCDVKHVVSVEEHFLGCGLGSALLQEYVRSEPSWRLHTLGIGDAFIHEVKTCEGMRDHFGISGERIATFVRGIVDGGASCSGAASECHNAFA